MLLVAVAGVTAAALIAVRIAVNGSPGEPLARR